MKATASQENYLKALWTLSASGGGVRAADLARHMGLTKASVSGALKKLRAQGYVVIDGGGGLTLTDPGRRLAEAVARRDAYFQRLLSAAGIRET